MLSYEALKDNTHGHRAHRRGSLGKNLSCGNVLGHDYVAHGVFFAFGFARVLCQVNGVTGPPLVNIWTRYLTFVFVGWRFLLLVGTLPNNFV